VLRVDNAKIVQDICVRGTNQGTAKGGKPFSFHGIQLFNTVNPTLKRIKLTDIAGSAGVPPDETFGIYGYNISGTFTCEDIILEGLTMEGASGISCQSKGTLDVVLRRIQVKGRPNGSGWTIFNTTLNHFEASDFSTDGSLCGLNFEHLNVNGGAKVHNEKDSGIVLNRLDIRNPSDRSYKPGVYSHIALDSSAAAGGVSNRVDIHDPIGITASHKFGITISASYGYANVPSGPQAQRGADIHLWMGNTERNDLIAWLKTPGAA
jgi:hypothetical protein